jgi:predicted dinucleotide-binding enzyme
MKLAFIGVGQVGGALASCFSRLGHEIIIAARDPGSPSVRAASAALPGARVTSLDGVRDADVVFLATPYAGNEAALQAAGPALDGRVLVDCTNPVGPGLTHGLASERSGAEVVQALAPRARVVKAFTIYGYENFADPAYPGAGAVKPAMLIAGDDAAAKRVVYDLCAAAGWEPVDVGPLSASLHLEHMTLLWIKMARVQGAGPDFVWARLRR